MENKHLTLQVIEAELLLQEAEELLALGNVEEAKETLLAASEKLRPIGSGTLGPRPKPGN